MAPPFSPTTSESLTGDDDDEEGTTSRRGRRGGARNRTDASPLEDTNNVLSTIDQILLENDNAKKKKSLHNQDPDDKRDDNDKKKTQLDPYYEQSRNVNKFALEIPVEVHYPDKKASAKESSSRLPSLNLSQNAQCYMHCFVPPSTPKGRWTGSITGNTKVFQSVGSAQGSADISYKATPHVRLMGGAHLITTKDTRPLQLHVGTQLKSTKNQSTLQVTLQQGPQHTWGISVLTREIMDPWVFSSNMEWNSSIAPAQQQTTNKKKKSDAGGKAMIWLSSMTTHVVRLGCGWAFLPYSMSLVHLMVIPKLSSNRRLPLSFQYQPTSQTWNASVTFQTQKPKKDAKKKAKSKSSSPASSTTNGSSSTPASWKVGIQGGGKPALQFRWSILVAWQHGDISIRVPIMLGTAASIFQSTKQDNDHVSSTLVTTVTPFVVIAIVGMANEMLSRFLWQGSTDSSDGTAGGSSSTHPSLSSEPTTVKAKKDAAAQQRLMQRQAESRTAAELEKNGLVIHSAVYEFGDEHSWDVTIPLKFWVNTEKSTLNLSMGSKQHLLGFYPLISDIEDSVMEEVTTPGGTNDTNKQQTRVPWWKEYWTPTKQRSRPKASSNKKDDISKKPTLKVRYSYEGMDFEKAVQDDEALNLPHHDVDTDTS